MHQKDISKLQITHKLGMSRWQVRRFVERVPKAHRRTILTPFESLLQAQWQAGERTTPALFRAQVVARIAEFARNAALARSVAEFADSRQSLVVVLDGVVHVG